MLLCCFLSQWRDLELSQVSATNIGSKIMVLLLSEKDQSVTARFSSKKFNFGREEVLWAYFLTKPGCHDQWGCQNSDLPRILWKIHWVQQCFASVAFENIKYSYFQNADLIKKDLTPPNVLIAEALNIFCIKISQEI